MATDACSAPRGRFLAMRYYEQAGPMLLMSQMGAGKSHGESVRERPPIAIADATKIGRTTPQREAGLVSRNL